MSILNEFKIEAARSEKCFVEKGIMYANYFTNTVKVNVTMLFFLLRQENVTG